MKQPIEVNRADLLGAVAMFGGPRAAFGMISAALGAPELPPPVAAICDALERADPVTVAISAPGVDHQIVIR